MTTVILPVAGHSSRFPDMRPKWLLTHPNGNLMFHESLMGLSRSGLKKLLIVCRKDHAATYGIRDVVKRQMAESPLKADWTLLEIPPTQSQPETVAVAIERARLRGPILIKDSDNYFTAPIPKTNSVMTMDFNTLPFIDGAAQKSYAEIDARGRLINIVENASSATRFARAVMHSGMP